MDATSTPRAWPLENEPRPVRLMNTIWADTTGVHDALSSVAELRAWIEATALGGDRPQIRPSRGELDSARELRDALRRLAAQVTGDPRPGAAGADADALVRALAMVNAWGQRRPVDELALVGGRLERVHATMPSATMPSATEAVLAGIAAEAIAWLGSPERGRLHACEAPGCVLYFSAGHARREWCSEACGNRARAARHYQRVRTARGSQLAG